MVQALPAQDGEATDPADAEADIPQELMSLQSISGDLSIEMRCVAGVIYFEARGKTLGGQLAVGRMIINCTTSGRFASSYCGVFYQLSQFWFVRGRSMPSVSETSVDWREAPPWRRSQAKVGGTVKCVSPTSSTGHSGPRWHARLRRSRLRSVEARTVRDS